MKPTHDMKRVMNLWLRKVNQNDLNKLSRLVFPYMILWVQHIHVCYEFKYVYTVRWGYCLQDTLTMFSYLLFLIIYYDGEDDDDEIGYYIISIVSINFITVIHV